MSPFRGAGVSIAVSFFVSVAAAAAMGSFEVVVSFPVVAPVSRVAGATLEAKFAFASTGLFVVVCRWRGSLTLYLMGVHLVVCSCHGRVDVDGEMDMLILSVKYTLSYHQISLCASAYPSTTKSDELDLPNCFSPRLLPLKVV